MHKYLILLTLVILSSCTLPNMGKTPVSQTGSSSEASTSGAQTPGPNSTVSVNYTLRDGSPTGPILETSKEDVARANGLYATGMSYKPLEVTLGSKSVIPGFESGILSMKKGETKMIEVLPKDGYGEAYITTTVAKGEIAPSYTVTADINMFKDKSTQVIQRQALGEDGVDITVGKTLTGGKDITAVVTKIDGENITVDIDNRDNPFYGKKIAPGLKATKDNMDFTITGLTATGVTLDIINRNSPFSGKDFSVGAVAPVPENPNGVTGEIKILSMSGELVEISLPNPNRHPLLGKTLYFEVELLDIK